MSSPFPESCGQLGKDHLPPTHIDEQRASLSSPLQPLYIHQALGREGAPSPGEASVQRPRRREPSKRAELPEGRWQDRSQSRWGGGVVLHPR